MGHFLKRYLSGDCETVWQELVDLKVKSLEPAYIDEATELAEEMVRRIIHNANIIGQYLVEAGYEFETPGPFVIHANFRKVPPRMFTLLRDVNMAPYPKPELTNHGELH